MLRDSAVGDPDAQVPFPELGVKWRKTVWEDYLLELEIAELVGDRILVSTVYDLALLSLDGEILTRGTWPEPRSERDEFAAAAHGSGFALVTNGPSINPWFLLVEDSLDSVEPVELEGVRSAGIASDGSDITLLSSSGGLEDGDGWLDVLEFDGSEILSRTTVDNRRWDLSGPAYFVDGFLFTCRRRPTDGSLNLIRIGQNPVSVDTLVLTAGPGVDARCRLNIHDGVIVATWAHVPEEGGKSFQTAARVSASDFTFEKEPTLIQKTGGDISQHVLIGDRIVGLWPGNPAALFSFDAETFAPLPARQYSFGEENQYFSLGMQLMTDGVDPYLAFTYNKNGINYTPVEVARLDASDF